MDTNPSVAIIASSATMVTGVFGMWINTSGIGKRIDEMSKRIDDMGNGLGKRIEDLRADLRDLRVEVKDLRTEFHTFKEVVTGKFRDLDLELAKLMDRPK
jgi:hypothetical protein